MGCCEAKASSGTLRIRYKGTEFSLKLTSPWSLIQEKLWELDSVLRWKAWILRSKQPPFSIAGEDDLEGYRQLSKRKGALEVEIDPGYVPPEGVNGAGIGLLLDEKGDIKGCGVLITPVHVLTSSELIPDRESLKGFSLFFPPKTRIILKRGGAYLRADELFSVLLELHAPAPVFPMKIRETGGAFSSLQALFMSAKYPALQHMPDIRVSPEGRALEAMDKAPAEALGAALFRQDGRFAGVYVGHRRGKDVAVMMESWVRYYRERVETLEDDERNDVLEVFREMGVAQREEKRRNRAMRTQATEPASVEVEIVEDWSKPQPWDISRPYCLHHTLTGLELWSHSGKDRTIWKETLENAVGLGCTLTVCDTGLVLAGGKEPSLRKAFLWNQRMQPLPTMPSAHIYHCSVYFLSSKVFLIGGESNSNLSCLHTQTNTWSRCSDLPIPLSQAGASADKDLLYVAGGLLASGLRSTRIYLYSVAREEWSVLNVALEKGLSGLGMRVLSEREIVVFGGETDRGEVAEWGIIGRERKRMERTGKFRETAPGQGQDFEVFSEEGALFQYEQSSFRLLCEPNQ